MSTTNGGPTLDVGGTQTAEFGVLAQYIKDFSFENPNAPRSLSPLQQQPEIAIQVNVTPKALSNTDFEVELHIDGKAEANGLLLFSFDLTFAGVFRLQNIPPENVSPLVMIEAPRLPPSTAAHATWGARRAATTSPTATRTGSTCRGPTNCGCCIGWATSMWRSTTFGEPRTMVRAASAPGRFRIRCMNNCGAIIATSGCVL